MKKLAIILILALIAGAGIAQNKTGAIRTGYTMLVKPFLFTAADSVAGNGGSFIKTSETYYVTVQNIQKYLQHQTFTTTLTAESGSPSVLITAYGKVNPGDSWVSFGTPITWTTTGNNPATITSTTPLNYNYLKLEYVCSGATQCVRIATLELKTANVFDIGASAAYVIGNGSGTVAINSSDWDISTTGIMTGIGAITTNGLVTGTAGATLTGAAINLNASSNFATNINTGTTNAALTLGGGSGTVAVNSSVWDVSTAGVVTGLTGVTTTGVLSAGALVTTGIDTCRGSQTAKSVTGISILKVDAACTLKGLAGGVTGQLLRIINTTNTTLVLTHNGTTTQKIMISGGSNKTISTQYGGVTMVFDGTNWYVTGNGQ